MTKKVPPGGQKMNFGKTNRKNGLAFNSTLLEPKKYQRPASISEDPVPLYNLRIPKLLSYKILLAYFYLSELIHNVQFNVRYPVLLEAE